MLHASSPGMKSWKEAQSESRDREIQSRRYCVFAAPTMETMARRLEDEDPSRFMYYGIDWGKFPDGTDNITMEGFHPYNNIAGEHVLFIASFHNNDVTLSQFSVLIVLLQSFIKSLTIVLPFYPVGTNERVEFEGKVATANTYSILLSNLPTAGTPNRLMIYDIHALQNRFYFQGSTIPSLHTAVPLLIAELRKREITTILFPDDGAAKRFKPLFRGFDFVICGKVRDGNSRLVRIQDGDPTGKTVVIVDDLVQTGGTLYESALAVKAAGAKEVHAFAAHAVFPQDCWQKFVQGGERAVFETFWVTNSIPSVTDRLPRDSCFHVLDLMPQIIHDLGYQ